MIRMISTNACVVRLIHRMYTLTLNYQINRAHKVPQVPISTAKLELKPGTFGNNKCILKQNIAIVNNALMATYTTSYY